jgi:hypothetical protein
LEQMRSLNDRTLPMILIERAGDRPKPALQ